MGILSRMSTVFKAKANRLMDRVENPHETLDYSYQKQLELLQSVKRGLAEVVTSKKRLELQTIQLKQNVEKLNNQAKDAIKADREDLARLALERKNALESQLDGLDEQIKGLEREQEKLAANEARLKTKVEAFRSQKEVIKAQYSAAEAGVRIGEATSGLSEELADVSFTVQRAKDKTDGMKARAAAIEELTETGSLDDVLGSDDDIDKELKRLSTSQKMNDELERLKKEVSNG